MANNPKPQRVDPTADATRLAKRIQGLVERSQKVWAQSLERSLEDMTTLKPDPLNAAPAMAKLAHDYLDHPQKVIEAGMEFWAGHVDLWTRSWQRALGEPVEPVVEPDPGDRRFKDETWEKVPFFDFLKQSYLLTGNWLKDNLEKADGLSPRDRRKLELVVRNFIEAQAPSNYPGLNPEVLKTTVEQKGENLLRGLENAIRDMERGRGVLMIRQTDMEAFKVGENMATTPGQVVYQNDVMQLIQYTPTTAQVWKRPLLFVPPWINKFYILDLNEKKSMVRWLVEQGHRVFVISWVNPDERHRDETWASYMRKGPLTAIEKALEETGSDKVNIVGYCIGGTLLGTTLAAMAEDGDDRIASASFFTAQLDFTDAGELQAFVDDEVIDTVEGAVGDRGFLAAENMAGAFNSLRSTDLIWSFVINNYLLGRDNFPFDLLYWNSDSTCMPGQVHVFYLDGFYNRNLLAKREMVLEGKRLDLAKVTVPSYHVATAEDHIAPAASVYRGATLLGGNRRFVLTGSGHIAGVVNHPAGQKYQYWSRTGTAAPTLEEWRTGAKETPGSWWPDWDKWLRKHSGSKVKATPPGGILGTIEPAPGSYVTARFDQR